MTSISATQITLSEADGKAETIPLIPTWSVTVSKLISVDQIKPGTYLGTTNIAKANGTGRSTEVHVSAPGVKGPGVDFVMDSSAHTTMTNGIVGTVVESAGGRVLEINYGTGERRVTVPPGTPVVLNTRGSRDLVKVGRQVRIVSFTMQTGGPPRQIVTVGANGEAPPG